MAKKKPLLKAEAERESVCGDLITRWLGLAGVLLSSALFLFNQDSAQVKITVFYAAVSGAFAFWLSDIFERIFDKPFPLTLRHSTAIIEK